MWEKFESDCAWRHSVCVWVSGCGIQLVLVAESLLLGGIICDRRDGVLCG